MPKIKITRPCVIDGVAVAVDEIVEASEKDARYVCAIGKALPVANAINQAKIDELNDRLLAAQTDLKPVRQKTIKHFAEE